MYRKIKIKYKKDWLFYVAILFSVFAFSGYNYSVNNIHLPQQTELIADNDSDLVEFELSISDDVHANSYPKYSLHFTSVNFKYTISIAAIIAKVKFTNVRYNLFTYEISKINLSPTTLPSSDDEEYSFIL